MMENNMLTMGNGALALQMKRGLLREMYQHKLVTEEQYIRLTEQQRGR